MTAVWYVIFFTALIWSGIRPRDYFTWLLEVAPAIVAAALLCFTRRRFRFTPLAFWLILLHSVILMVGGHYTYAEVPLFNWLKEGAGAARNNYDKVGHFAQGFVPAIAAREILLRNRVVNGRHWLSLFVISFCLAVSALYELAEWWVAELSGDEAAAFLGTQGYVWDTQSDMAYCLLGAVCALVILGRYHDRQIEKIASRPE